VHHVEVTYFASFDDHSGWREIIGAFVQPGLGSEGEYARLMI